MAGHLMVEHVRAAEPGSGKRVEWKRIGALFMRTRSTWRCAGLHRAGPAHRIDPAYIGARIIDVAFPHQDYPLLAKLSARSSARHRRAAIGRPRLRQLIAAGIMRDMRTSLVAHLHKMPSFHRTDRRSWNCQ